jgi:LysM repeat protein
VIAKKLLRTRKEYGVSAEELKRANPFLEEEGLQIGQVITIPSKTTTPRIIVKTPKNAVVQKDTFIMMCLQKKLNILLLKVWNYC